MTVCRHTSMLHLISERLFTTSINYLLGQSFGGASLDRNINDSGNVFTDASA